MNNIGCNLPIQYILKVYGANPHDKQVRASPSFSDCMACRIITVWFVEYYASLNVWDVAIQM